MAAFSYKWVLAGGQASGYLEEIKELEFFFVSIVLR
jgi:hypothetical protein